MEFLAQIDTFQWILIALGGVILFWPSISGLLKIKNNNVDKPDKPFVPSKKDNECLTSLVCKWECLADACKKSGLNEASKRLDEVFPLLIVVKENEIDVEN